MMRNDKLDEQLAAAQSGIRFHWRATPSEDDEEELEEGAVTKHCAPVLDCVETFFEALKATEEPAPPEEIIAAMERLFSDLDDANENAEGMLLTGGERDLLLPIVNEAAKTAGLRPGDVQGSDSSQPYHDF